MLGDLMSDMTPVWGLLAVFIALLAVAVGCDWIDDRERRRVRRLMRRPKGPEPRRDVVVLYPCGDATHQHRRAIEAHACWLLASVPDEGEEAVA